MLILLPPSETKRDGGEAETSLDYGSLSYPELTSIRKKLVQTVRNLAKDEQASVTALKLGRTQLHEVERNRAVSRSNTMPAVDRYTGVLYDALDAASLSSLARDFLAQKVVIHSALFGLSGALDAIPSYRLSHNSRLPGVKLPALWSKKIAHILVSHSGLILDARSEAYVVLGPAPLGDHCVYLRVVTRDEGGRKRALNHFNKKAKGELVRSIAMAGVEFERPDELVNWGSKHGWSLELSPESSATRRELYLVV